LKQDGSIIAWGNNNSGECDIPFPNTGFIAIAAGQGLSLAIKSDDMCNYVVAGDLNYDCTVNLEDLAIMVSSWLVDCKSDPTSICIPK